MNAPADRSTSPEGTVVRIGVLGGGNVGAAFVESIDEDGAAIERRTGLRLEIASIAVRSLTKPRAPGIDTERLTLDAHTVVGDPTIDVIVELIGGIEPARTLIVDALKSGKSVVSANKELLANYGAELHRTAEAAGVELRYEAAVGGAIPLVRALSVSMRGEPVRRVMGIVNGTTNYILSRMSEERMTYAGALAEAERLGYAERDPSADVEGYDASSKAAILASIAFAADVVAGDVYREGIESVEVADIEFAHRLGYEVKLLAVAERTSERDAPMTVGVRVHPAMVPTDHPLAGVRGAFNAVFIEGEHAGELMLYGRGAGGQPTASAVLGDVIDVAERLVRGGTSFEPRRATVESRPIDELWTQSYLTIDVADRPGVLATVASAFNARRLDPLDGTGRSRSRGASRVHHAPRTRGGRPGDARGTSTARRGPTDRRAPPGHRPRAQMMGNNMDDRRPQTATTAIPWGGLIATYREFLPVSDATPNVTLYEGNTPLLPAPRLSARVGAEVFLKIEGANPTGSFKDRGMTVAMSKALEEGARAVVCASTGNTSASAAAYAARAGLSCIVLIPEGHIALGKLAQALVHGARVLQVRDNFDVALEIVRLLPERAPVVVVNSVNPHRIDGQKSGAFEIVDVLGDAPEMHCIPVGNAGNITAYWRGYRQYQDAGKATHTPRMLGFQAAGSAPIVDGHPIEHPETIATAIRIGNPASWYGATAAASESGGSITAVTDEQILDAYRFLAAEESVFCEAASAASVAGLIKVGVPKGSRVVCVLTGHGLKDPDLAISQISVPEAVEATFDSVVEALGI